MFVEVQLLKGLDKSLLYKVPKSFSSRQLIGSIVKVPLRNTKVSALVIKQFPTLQSPPKFEIKELLQVQILPQDKHYANYIDKLAKFYFIKPQSLYRRIQSFLYKKDKMEEELENPLKKVSKKNVTLTQEQDAIVQSIQKHIDNSHYQTCLLHGVTGSGKTEVYKSLINRTLKQNKTVLFLLPEVSLSMQFEYLFKQQMPHVATFSFHSLSKAKEKRSMWQSLVAQKPCLIIGVHLPVLLPIPNLGLIIIDEEHEAGFQEKKHPKINSKQAALWRAHLYNIPIVLGSATPSLTSLYNVSAKTWKFYQLKKRFSGTFPEIQTVLLTDKTRRKKRNFWLSQELEEEITTCLSQGKQAIIYLNRRGYSFFVQCKECGYTFECSNCSVSLTLHDKNNLRCHYCDYETLLPSNCPGCKADEKKLLKKGIGTQQLVQILQKRFPSARIERADLDSTKKKRNWQDTVKQFSQGNLDILVGTKTITKGYHFPNVTLVGILWGDLSLHLPQYNAGETTLQELIQVAGRAGRSSENSKVVMQIMQDHKIFNYINETSYLSFAKAEFNDRKEILYPPFCRLLCLEIRHKDADVVEREAQEIAEKMFDIIAQEKLSITLLGPAHPVVHKIQKIEIRHIFLKSRSFNELSQLLKTIMNTTTNSSKFVIHQ